MCGIVGFIDPGSASLDERAAYIARMSDALIHRGPDANGASFSGPAALGHRRLSIVDLEGGTQPLETEDGRYTVTFNGEIYNQAELRDRLEAEGVSLRTRCDTEVLPHLYHLRGEQMLPLLRGMFAFAIWDELGQTAFLARDRFGIKPLYYAVVDGSLYFASELDALSKHPNVPTELDDEAIALYFVLGYIPEPYTPYKGVRKLPAGHFMRWTQEVVSVERYWDLTAFPVEPPMPNNDEEQLAQLDELLRESVRLRLMSDVPVGAFLSGGLDSGLVVSYMAELSTSPVQTFSIGRGDALCELPWARKTVSHFHTDHTEMVVEPDAVKLLETLVHRVGEPFGDSSIIPTLLVSELARSKVKVCLSGDGGDELFAGYGRYARAEVTATVGRLPHRLLRGAGSVTEKVDTQFFRSATRLLRRASQPYAAGYLDGVSSSADALGLRHGEAAKERARRLFSSHDRGESAIRTAQYIDTQTYLVNDILTKVDRASMATSLEVRIPLLDHVLAEWVNRQHTRTKRNRHHGKLLLRRLAARRLPEELLNKPKTGFGVPVAAWLRGPLREMARDLLLPPSAACSRWVDSAAIARLLSRHEDGTEDHSPQLWSLLFLERWMRR